MKNQEFLDPRHDCYYLEPSAELPEEAPVSAAYEASSALSSRFFLGPWLETLVIEHVHNIV